MAAVAAFVVMGALATGCGDKEQPGARNAADAGPGTAGSSASPSPTAKPKPHKKKRAHPKRHHRHHATAHPRRHHPKRTHKITAPHRTAKPKPRPSAPSVGTAVEATVVKLVNKERAKQGCKALRVDRRLRAAAYLHSRDMGLHHYFDHDSKDGRTPWDRIKAQGYLWPSAENIAAGQPTPASVMDAWMHSAGHRANILNCSYKAIGVGEYKGGGTPIWTQDFGFK
jgi:uncharacterized protein YkwD